MYYFLLLQSLAIFWSTSHSDLPWVHDFEQAKTTAIQENKHILLVFSGSDWCRNCMLLDRDVFSDQVFESLSRETLVLVKADFPRKKRNQLSNQQKLHNEGLAKKFNPNGEFPRVLLMDHEERVLFTSNYSPGHKDKFLAELNTHLGK